MTKPTVTQSQNQSLNYYGIFRKDAQERIQKTALQGVVYSSYNDAVVAFNQLKRELPSFLRSTIEVRPVTGVVCQNLSQSC